MRFKSNPITKLGKSTVMPGINPIGVQIFTSPVRLDFVIMVVKKYGLVLEMNMDSSTMMGLANHHPGLTLNDRKERVSSTPSG